MTTKSKKNILFTIIFISLIGVVVFLLWLLKPNLSIIGIKNGSINKAENITNIEKSNINGVAGKVVSIDIGSITINNGREDVTVKLDANTTFIKRYADPVESRNVMLNINDIEMGSSVIIAFTPESKEANLIAESVNIMGNRFITGNIFSITNDKIVINDNITKEEYRFNLSDKTTYYKQIDVQQGETYKPDTISFNDLKIGNLVLVFYVDSSDKNNITAEKILLVPIKEEIKP